MGHRPHTTAGAVWVAMIVLDVYNEFVPHSCCMRLVTDALDLDDKPVSRQQEVHPSCRSCIAWRELLRANIGDPRAELRMEQILDVILGLKEQRTLRPYVGTQGGASPAASLEVASAEVPQCWRAELSYPVFWYSASDPDWTTSFGITRPPLK